MLHRRVEFSPLVSLFGADSPQPSGESSKMTAAQVFISAVSEQFKPCRDQLAADLRSAGFRVIVQEDLRQGSGMLLKKLEDTIASCDRVVVILGNAYGHEPDPSVATPESPRRSYAQWEWYFALGERLDSAHQPPKAMFVYIASECFLASRNVKQSADKIELQRQFVDTVLRSGKDRARFRTIDELRALALRDAFPSAHAEIPRHNLPYCSIGQLFKGRGDALAKLREGRRRHDEAGDGRLASNVGQILHGIGGVGKSRLAVEFAWEQLDGLSAALFVTADSVANLHRNLASLASRDVLSLSVREPGDQQLRFDAVVGWLESNSRWMLILDNVDTDDVIAAVESMLPRLRRGQVIITSRQAEWSAGIETIEINPLTSEAATEFVLDRTSDRRCATDRDHADASAIAAALDGLALALEQAGAYISHQRCSLREYLARWNDRERTALEWADARLMKYPRSLATTWNVTLDQLTTKEFALLQMTAWMSPDPIPRLILAEERIGEYLQKSCTLIGAEFQLRDDEDESGSEALLKLCSWSLAKLNRDRSAFTVHRVLQQVIRMNTPDSQVRNWISITLGALNAAVVADPADPRGWPNWSHLAAHLGECGRIAARYGLREAAVVTLSRLGGFYFFIGEFALAESAFRDALDAAEIHFEAGHESIACQMSNLARSLVSQGKLDEAEQLIQRAMKIEMGLNNPSRERIGGYINALYQLCSKGGRYIEAEILIRRALEADTVRYGENNEMVLVHLTNLAVALLELRRHIEARDVALRAVRVSFRLHGPLGLPMAASLTSLGGILCDLDQLRGAAAALRRADVICTKHYNRPHLKHAETLLSLGFVLIRREQSVEAETVLRRAIAMLETLGLGASDEMGRARYLLGSLCRLLGRVSEANSLLREARAIQNDLSNDHNT